EANSANALIAGGGFLWLGDSYDGWVFRIDPDAGTAKRFKVNQGADRLAFADQRLWILDTATGSLRAITRRGELTRKHSVLGNLTDMSAGGHSVWITDAADDQLLQIPMNSSSAGNPISLANVAEDPPSSSTSPPATSRWA